MLTDAAQRTLATNPTQSFIVQAPAGSGKTEILTQRYLRLLSRVTAPEQIIALTFTRKAANEMRERIILALHQSSNTIQAKSPHQQITLDFAKAALEQDKRHQWDLLHHPNRLGIMTIDALCQRINQAIPLMEKQIAYSQVTEKASRHYLVASRRCIQFALDNPEYQAAIKTLLLHVDNRQDRLLELFRTLLAQRDQWLSPLFCAKTQEKSTFEQALSLIEEHGLTRFKQSVPVHLIDTLLHSASELALIENNPNSPRFLLKDWNDFQKTTRPIATALSKLLLTTDGSIRKSFDHHVGLVSTSCPSEEYKRIKNGSKELLSELAEYPDFLEALVQVSDLPEPEYNLEQWEVLHALFLLLPLLVGHLQLLFLECNEVDFTAISQQALAALGDSDCPTDLALYLDNAIHHLLIDEFQDTSITQFELLSRLVHGWEKGDGKTLFLVGDPMQSIYRFRQAEVGLFFRAKEQGIGSVTLNALELKCNFRSTKTLVDWVNTHFSKILPKKVDIESGAVSFHASTNAMEQEQDSFVSALEFKNKEQEAEYLMQIIRQELCNHPEQSMAILVRSRTHLTKIISLLRQHQIPYQGTDITLLANLRHLRDVWTLTKALLFPANRLSWLSLLRSPYCGLKLEDIHTIANFDKKKSIYSTLLQLDTLQGLSEEGTIRASFFINIMHKALIKRYESKLSAWIMATLNELHINKILTQSERNDLEQFWTLLDSHEQNGRLEDIPEFLKELNKLYSQQTTPSALHVMTIHKSKGLEFDTVFLPGLGTQPNRNDPPMLRWLSLPTQKQGNILLMSPIQAAHQERCAVYDYLGRLDEVKNFYEAQRVLYVATTRAKSRLYLMDHCQKTSKNSFRSLLKHQAFKENKALDLAESNPYPAPKLMQLPLHCYQNNDSLMNRHEANYSKNPPSTLSTSMPRLIGIVTHYVLQWICDNHPKSFQEIPWNLASYQFKMLGFSEAIQIEALNKVQEQIERLFQDPLGNWIISKQDNEHNEYELLIEHQGKPVIRIIDRIFEEHNKFWIIDFKTGKEEEHKLIQHRLQLNEYGSYLSEHTKLPIHCGIYYLANNHWVHWEYLRNKVELI
jgi:ATP-dependent exoDNAse (exonuclease V) beta subunit